MEQTATSDSIPVPGRAGWRGISLPRLTGKSVILFAALFALFGWWIFSPRSSGFAYRTAPAEKGDLVVTIDATGTVEPVEVIDVGAQVAGMISAFGTDKNGKTIDYGSEVEEGTKLAQIDDSLYQAEVNRSRAEVQVAKAQVAQAQAKLAQAQRDWNRAQILGPTNAMAKANYDAFEAAYRLAQAEIGVAEGAVAQAEAAQFKAEKNLGYTTISAPVRGVIIDRRVNIGQTVVSSLNAPSLFLIAKDLRQMQVWVSVNEADIGSIFPGQQALFTVDARPGEKFSGTVGKIRLNASMNQNVVTYVVEVNTDNSDNRLLPYLTANVRFQVKDLRDVLLVPNSAARWSPGKGDGAPGRSEQKSSPKPPQEIGARAAGETKPVVSKVWRLAGDSPEPIDVKLLGTDGRVTAVESQALQAGDPVIIGRNEAEDGTGSSSSGNPFVPQMPRGSRRGGFH